MSTEKRPTGVIPAGAKIFPIPKTSVTNNGPNDIFVMDAGREIRVRPGESLAVGENATMRTSDGKSDVRVDEFQ